MGFGHEQLDVYRLSVDYVAWSYALAKELSGVDRHARDQLLRAAQSIPLNVAEGKTILLRIVSMLTKLARRDHELREEPARYGVDDYDNEMGYVHRGMELRKK